MGWVPHAGVLEIVTQPPHPHTAAKSSDGARKFHAPYKLSSQAEGGGRFMVLQHEEAAFSRTAQLFSPDKPRQINVALTPINWYLYDVQQHRFSKWRPP